MAVKNNMLNDDSSTLSIFEVLMIIKKRILFVFFIILIIVGGFWLYSLYAPRVYSVSGYVEKHFYFMNSNMDNSGEKGVELLNIKLPLEMLQALPQQQQADKLGIDVKLMEDIKRVTVSVKDSTALKIEILTLNVSSAERLLSAYQGYINNLPIVKRYLDFLKKIMTLEHEKLAELLEKSPGDMFQPGDKVVISEVYSSLYSMEKEYIKTPIVLTEIEKGLFIFGDVYKSGLPIKPQKRVLLFAGVFISVLSGILSAFFMEWLSIVKIKYKSQMD